MIVAQPAPRDPAVQCDSRGAGSPTDAGQAGPQRPQSVETRLAAKAVGALRSPDQSELEDELKDLLDQPNLGATTIPAGFKPTKLQLLDAMIAAKNRQRAAEIDQVALVSGLCDAYRVLNPIRAGTPTAPHECCSGSTCFHRPSMDCLPSRSSSAMSWAPRSASHPMLRGPWSGMCCRCDIAIRSCGNRP